MQILVFIFLFTYFGVVYNNCPETTFLLEQLGITVTVPNSAAPSFQGSNELCVDDVYNIAVFECQSNSQWTPEPIILTSQCSITANVTFMQILKGVIINGTADQTLLTLPFTKFVITDVANIIDLLEEIVQHVNNAQYDGRKVSYIKYTLFQVYGLLMTETKFLLLRNSSLFAINKLLTSIEYTAENMITSSSYAPEFYDTSAFSVSIFPIVSNWTVSQQTIGISYLNSNINITSCKANACSSFRTNDTSIRFSMNPIIVDVISKKSKSFNATPHLNFVTYKSTEYFQYNVNSTLSVFGTPTAVSISNYDELSSFINKIDLIYVEIYDNPKSVIWKRNTVLAYLVMNRTKNIWSTDGCRNLTTSISACNHLTHFAVLMDVEQVYVNGTSSSVTASIEELVLTIISYIAICLSLIGLLITMLTFLCFKKLRAHYSQKCIFNLALALFFMYLFFIVNTSLTELKVITSSDAGCVVVAVVLHYFILASFFWMLVMAFIQYIMFIKVFPYYISNFAGKAAAISWGVPLIPIIISISLNYSPSVVIQMPNQFVYGKIGNVCWIQGLPFYMTVLLPIGLIVLLNTSIFIAVAVNLVWSTKTSDELYENQQYDPKQERPRSGRTTSAKATNNFTKKATCNRLIAAIFSCFVILGLTWLFGFLAINQVRIAFSYLFCLFNASQGFMILIAYVLMSKPKREMWNNKFKAIKKSLHNMSNRTSSAEFDTPGNSDQHGALRKKKQRNFNHPAPRGVFSVETDDSHDSRSNILPSLHKNSFTSTPKPRTNQTVSRGVRHASSSTSASSNEYTPKKFDEMIKNDLDIKGFIERRNEKRKFPFSLPFQKSEFVKPSEFLSKPDSFLRSQKGVLASNKHLVSPTPNIDNQKSIVNIHTRPELLSSFSVENNALRTALGFNGIVPTPIMSAKNRKNIQTRRESTNDSDFQTSYGHRSRLSSQSTNDARTITPSGVSVNGSETTVPGSVFYRI